MTTGRWWRDISREQWRVLVASHLGWLLDGFDTMLYSFSLLAIKSEFGLSGGQAGLLAAATLFTSAIGGILGGLACDHFGRTRVLMASILSYSLFSGLTATAHSFAALLLWRSLVGLGLGAEWPAGSVLVAETWPSEHRGKAIGLVQSGWALGYIAAAIVSAWFLPRLGWRSLFILGCAPAFVVLWVRRNVQESAIWVENRRLRHDRHTAPSDIRFSKILLTSQIKSAIHTLTQSPYLGRVLICSSMSAFLLFAYWGLFTWIPAYLSTPKAQGGAGLSTLATSGWIIPMQFGAFLGYLTFGFIADRIGQKVAFQAFVLVSAILTPLYALGGQNEFFLLLLGPFLGFFGHGYFSVFGSLLSELFPTSVRATAQGFCYSAGKAISAFAPFVIGRLADAGGIASALAVTSAFSLAALFLIALLPLSPKRTLD